VTSEGSSPVDIDVLAAALRADLNDISAFVEGLATRLEGALPGFVRVKRVKRGFRGPKLVTEIAIETGGERLELRRTDDHVRTVRAKSSGGIVLKTEEIDIDTWLSALAAAVAEQAERSERTRQALQQLVLDR
jgi:hypothetical protein